MAETQDWGIVESQFKLQSHYYVHFQSNVIGKCYEASYPCNIMAEGFRFIYLAFGFSLAENLSAQHMGYLAANLSTGVDARARRTCRRRYQNQNTRLTGGCE